jgi:hypothetical protein
VSDEIVWEDPPPTHRKPNYDWLKVLEPLVGQPNRWAMVREVASATAGINIARLKARQLTIPRADHEWEFTSRRTLENKNRVKIYARYLGPKEGES